MPHRCFDLIVACSSASAASSAAATDSRVCRTRQPPAVRPTSSLREASSSAGFGALSLPLFRAIGLVTLSLSPPQTALLTFLVLVCPTLGMGATLPLLAEYLVLRRPNVGASVGMLYSLNTLGSAVAALAGATVLFRMLGQQGVIWTAVACNLLAAIGARWLLKAARRNQ